MARADCTRTYTRNTMRDKAYVETETWEELAATGQVLGLVKTERHVREVISKGGDHITLTVEITTRDHGCDVVIGPWAVTRYADGLAHGGRIGRTDPPVGGLERVEAALHELAERRRAILFG